MRFNSCSCSFSFSCASGSYKRSTCHRLPIGRKHRSRATVICCSSADCSLFKRTAETEVALHQHVAQVGLFFYSLSSQLNKHMLKHLSSFVGFFFSVVHPGQITPNTHRHQPRGSHINIKYIFGLEMRAPTDIPDINKVIVFIQILNLDSRSQYGHRCPSVVVQEVLRSFS